MHPSSWRSRNDLDVPDWWKFGAYTYRYRHYMHPNYQERPYHRDGFKYYRRVATSYSFYSYGMLLISVSPTTRKLDRDLWANFWHAPLPHNVTIHMRRVDFYKLLPWLRYDFNRWTVEAVPESGVNDIATDIEYRIGFDNQKDCAIFLLYKDAVLAGDVPISYPEPSRKIRRPK